MINEKKYKIQIWRLLLELIDGTINKETFLLKKKQLYNSLCASK